MKRFRFSDSCVRSMVDVVVADMDMEILPQFIFSSWAQTVFQAKNSWEFRIYFDHLYCYLNGNGKVLFSKVQTK